MIEIISNLYKIKWGKEESKYILKKKKSSGEIKRQRGGERLKEV